MTAETDIAVEGFKAQIENYGWEWREHPDRNADGLCEVTLMRGHRPIDQAGQIDKHKFEGRTRRAAFYEACSFAKRQAGGPLGPLVKGTQ